MHGLFPSHDLGGEVTLDKISAQEAKKLFSGDPLHVDKKYERKQTLRNKPCIMSSNHYLFGDQRLSPIDEKALRRRVIDIQFNNEWMCGERPMTEEGLLGFIVAHKSY